jgi:hypothetical protein
LVTIDQAGVYTLGNDPVILGGKRVMPGETLVLEAGTYRVEHGGVTRPVFWLGDKAPTPPSTPFDGPIYTDF